MDNVTHTLFALTLGRTRLGRSGRGATAALVLASNAPDLDIVAALGGSANYLAWHRGPTHGPLGVVGLGILAAALVWVGRRVLDSMRPAPRQRPLGIDAEPGATSSVPAVKKDDAPFGALVLVSMIGVLLHILMDLPTSYGTRLLSPFSWRWYAIDLMPIIDIYLLVVLIAGLVLGSRSPVLARRCAAIVLALMATNYGVRAVAHYAALKAADRLAGRSRPVACDARASSISLVDAWPPAIAPTGHCLVQTAAIPSFVSPLQWRVIAQFPDAYEIYEIDLTRRLDATTPRRRTLVPNPWTPVAAEAATTKTAQIFLGFSRLPVVQTLRDPSGVETVRFADMRFNDGFGGESPLQARRSGLFTVTVQIGPDSEVIQERLGE